MPEAELGIPGQIMPMKSASIWKSISSAWGVILPVAGCRRHDAVEDVVASGLVGVPQLVVGVGKRLGVAFGRSVDALGCHNLHECKVHVHVVVQAGILCEDILAVVIVPYDGDAVVDHAPFVLEFGGTAVSAAYGLCGPSPLDFVEQGGLVDGHGGAVGDFRSFPAGFVAASGKKSGRACRRESGCYDDIFHFRLE